MNLFERISTKLIFQKIKQYQTIEGWLSVKEAVNLYRFVSQVKGPQPVIVEIGSWKGKSTYCLAKGFSKGKLITIDPFDGSGENGSVEIYQLQKGGEPLIDQFKNNMKRLGVLKQIEILEGRSQQFIGLFSKIDLLFIDGEHSVKACDSDFLGYAPALVSGAYLIFHDYQPSRKELGPTWVVENRVLPSNFFKFIGLFDSLWVGQKV
jgi:hypothetical protein